MRILGIDPGLSGAVGWHDDDDGTFGAFDIPTMGEKTSRRVDGRGLLSRLQAQKIGTPMRWDFAYFELVHALPKQGVSSTFRFGEATGTITGVLAAWDVPIIRVTPQVWKKHYGLQGQQKEQSRAFAIQLFPKAADLLERKKDHQRAEALLIAAYGLWHQKRAAA